MSKKLLTLLMILGLSGAMPSSILASVGWHGNVDATWDYAVQPNNWTGDPLTGGYFTTECRISYSDWGEDIEPGIPEVVNMPVIADGNNTIWGKVNIRNSVVVTQTGGYHEWLNGSGDTSFDLHNELWWGDAAARDGVPYWEPATFQMTGGVHVVRGETCIGFDAYDPEGPGVLNIWGDGTFQVATSEWHPTALLINDNSVIDIRDNGILSVPFELKEVIDVYLDGGTFEYLNRFEDVIESLTPASGRIVNGSGGSLYTTAVGDETYMVTPFPFTLIPGDANLDGSVDVSDLGILATNYGTSSGAEWGDGDFTGDDMVNVSDLGILATHYGETASVASVPEPSALMLLCLGAFVSCLFIWRKERMYFAS